MKVENKTTSHSRYLRFTNVHPEMDELEVSVVYTGDSSGRKAVILDNVVIPAIIKGTDEDAVAENICTLLVNQRFEYFYKNFVRKHVKGEISLDKQKIVDMIKTMIKGEQ